MTGPVRDATADLLTTAGDLDVEQRLVQVSERAEFLARAARTVRGSMHNGRAMDLALELLVPALVDWAQLVVRDRGMLECRSLLAGHGVRRAAVPAPRAGRSTLDRVMSRGLRELTLVSLSESEQDSARALESIVPATELRADVAGIRPVDLLVVPLVARGRPFGALCLARRAGHGFDESAVSFLDNVAGALAGSLDATLTLADSRRVSSVLADALAPPALPRMESARLAAFYRVAFEQEAVGGDFYDIHGDEDDWTAVVGDVCGKGVEASVLTGRVRQAVRTAALVDRSPAAVLRLVNRVLVDDSGGTFVTAVCARVRRDHGDLRLEVAAAGHPEPFVLRRDGGLEPVRTGGTVLGVFDADGGYADVPVVLRPGDTCVFMTDGVHEAPGARDRFGEDRLRAALVAAPRHDVDALVESLAMRLSDFIGDRTHDDVAILAVQNPPSPAEAP